MDSTDLKIVSMLKKNARVSASAIAKEVGLAVSSVTERIRRLENSGVILQYTAVVDNSKIEGGITAMIGIKIEHTRYIDKLANIISEGSARGLLLYPDRRSRLSGLDLRRIHGGIPAGASQHRRLEGVASVKTYYILGTKSNEEE